MYEMKNGTLFFQDNDGNNVLALDNVDEIALTSATEERDILGNVENINIKKGETTLSFTGTIEKETLFKAMKEMDSSPERESVLRYMEYINGSFYRNVLFIPLYHDYIIHVCRNDISGFVPQEDAKDRIDITNVFRQY